MFSLSKEILKSKGIPTMQCKQTVDRRAPKSATLFSTIRPEAHLSQNCESTSGTFSCRAHVPGLVQLYLQGVSPTFRLHEDHAKAILRQVLLDDLAVSGGVGKLGSGAWGSIRGYRASTHGASGLGASEKNFGGDCSAFLPFDLFGACLIPSKLHARLWNDLAPLT